MSLFALPVTVSDLTTLQSGIQFFTNTAEATAQAAMINTPGTTTSSVFIYAAQLLANNIGLSQVAMGVSAIAEGGTIAVGTGNTTPNTLNLLSNVFLPPQFALGVTLFAQTGIPAPVYASEALGLALASTAGFQTTWAGLSNTAFIQALATATGDNPAGLQGFLTNWLNFYSGAGSNAHPGLTVQQAAYGATLGDGVGVALLNPTSANLQTVVSTNPGANPFTPNTVTGLVANALILNAEGKYVTGVALGALPAHQPLQGEAGQGGVFLTQGIDSPTTGFSLNPNGTPLLNGFTASQANSVFNALPFVSALGLGNNTLNTGDDLETTGAATGATTFNFTTTSFLTPANPSFAQGITMNGVNTLAITNNSTNPAAPVGGFSGKVTGLLVENNNNSVNPVTLGATNQGLNTLLTNININGYAGLPGSDINSVFLAAGIADLTKTINVAFTGGNLGTTALNGAQEFVIASDAGTGTAANPSKAYGTWALTINNNANLQISQSATTGALGTIATENGVGAATTLNLSGKGNVALGQEAAGDWRLLATINASGESGNVIIPGASTNTATPLFNSFASAANPFWLFGSNFGLLDNTGTGAFALTEYDLGSGLNILDVSTATAAQIGALKTVANATPSTGNIIIVQNAVATTTSATTFANVKGFDTLGIGGATAAQGANGTINLANLPASITTIDYFTPAAGSVFINNQTAALTVNVFDQTTAGQNLTVGKVGPAPGLNDSLTVIVGNPNHVGLAGSKGGDALGDINATGDEVFTITSKGGGNVADGVANGGNDLGGTILVPTLGGNEQVTISGDTTLQMAVTHSTNGAIQDQTAAGILNANNLSVKVTDTAATEWGQATAGPLVFQNDAGANGGKFAPFVNYSNNAVVIDATTSGGLISPWGDANFVGNQGDTITGAANPVGHATAVGGLLLGDVLGGSPGNDVIKSLSMTQPDYIVTNGGADTITLALGHTGADHIGFYDANGGVNAGGKFAVASVAGSIMEPGVAAFDFANPGWFGIASNGSSTRVDDGAGLFPGANGGTSASQSMVTNFVAGQDVLDFSGQAWAFTGVFTLGLVADTAGGLKNVGAVAGDTAPTGANTIAVQVGPGGTIAGTGADLIVLNQNQFLGAAAVAQALQGGTFTINHSALGGTVEADFLLAYTGADTFVHIADLHLAGTGAASTATNTDLVTVSDMVVLVGVTLPTFAAAAGATVHLIT
jgi:hypothetical protein